MQLLQERPRQFRQRRSNISISYLLLVSYKLSADHPVLRQVNSYPYILQLVVLHSGEKLRFLGAMRVRRDRQEKKCCM